MLTGRGRAFTGGMNVHVLHGLDVPRAKALIRALHTAIESVQKELMLRWRHTDLATAIEYGINAFATAYATDEPREGTRAFLEKRAPRFGSRS